MRPCVNRIALPNVSGPRYAVNIASISRHYTLIMAGGAGGDGEYSHSPISRISNLRTTLFLVEPGAGRIKRTFGRAAPTCELLTACASELPTTTHWPRINAILLMLVLGALVTIIGMLATGVRGSPLDPKERRGRRTA